MSKDENRFKFRWRAEPVTYGEDKWAYVDKHGIDFHGIEDGKAVHIRVPLRFLKKVLESAND